ncbi:MAG TPA: carboxypeptidase-like regulatory domain-containing protein [Lacipirellulaceae bacterium]|nr:carboxypeptidase-like regulatory domain-containing protein [Lacipirellulaceae bacterium]HMP07962.1 carboxypeptidase-like regulatory domain-containing protein [Lacipirellulaceae bacterium]
MQRLVLLACFMGLGLTATGLHAEPGSTNRGRTGFDSDVTVDGDSIVIEIRATQRVPLSALPGGTIAGASPQRDAQRLLLQALESRLLGGSPQEAVALLAEAGRFAPDDPHIAFWQASLAVDAGAGRIAQRLLELHDNRLRAAYPNAIDDLIRRVRQRVKLEQLPAALVARIDRLNSAAAQSTDDSDSRRVAVAFRIVDQHGTPVPGSAFRMEANGSDERFEQFDDGHVLYSFSRRRGSDSDRTVRLSVRGLGLKAQTHMLRFDVDRVELAGPITVHRYRDEDKQSVAVSVADAEGQPLAGARVSLRHVSGEGDDGLSAETDDQGRVTLESFPGEYSLSATATGYNAASASVELADAGVEQRLVMHPAIRAAVRIRWLSKPLPGGPPGMNAVTASEATLTVNSPGGTPYTPELQWLRAVQIEDRIVLHLNLTMFGPMYGPMMGADGGVWIKKQSADGDADDAAAERFDAIVLESVNDLPEGFEPVFPSAENSLSRPGMVQAPVQFGDILVGRIMGRDMRTGQPALVTFKAIIEHLTD